MTAKTQVLFVDDDALILSCYERLLSKRFSIEKALGPKQAIEALKHGPFAVVASDMRMPEMNGIELLKKVKEESPETVCLLLTGNLEMEDSEMARCGDLIFRLLQKPCPTPELVAAIEGAIEQYERNTQVRAL